jgi:hypothetical protein
MAPRIIYDFIPWRIELDPTMAGNNHLVRFYKHNGQRKLLDQIALWDPIAEKWSANRWIPKQPQIPFYVLTIAEAHMRGLLP